MYVDFGVLGLVELFTVDLRRWPRVARLEVSVAAIRPAPVTMPAWLLSPESSSASA
jgi:hypothetical protein